jgi:hypothetical protein
MYPSDIQPTLRLDLAKDGGMERGPIRVPVAKVIQLADLHFQLLVNDLLGVFQIDPIHAHTFSVFGKVIERIVSDLEVLNKIDKLCFHYLIYY